MELTKRFRLLLTITATFLIWGHLTWDYFHGGIPTHYILQDGNLPGIPNWVGGIVLPFFTWFLMYRIHKRTGTTTLKVPFRIVAYRFFAALLLAIVISVCFTMDIDAIDYMMLALFGLACIFPVYKAEYLLGWVFGSAFTFGAIIPIVFGSMLALIFFILYKTVRGVVGFFMPKKRKQS